ncbi:peptidyl-prolyl cis-trans isomerase sig-7 [Galleria mellonella]|uniref:Peptidyl-prolyl cis-trans isomerase n=1 Tax=Galleria mellonella TaxID=7137 RepID=A0A6J1WM75_GALME|nr:peptidyl-prolyl cis-trans isomerase sig-7 [Galleria mellonella]
MSVVIETTLGDITVDLYIEQRPVTCLNFLKLCKMKFYNYNLFHTIRSGFIAQTGDPTGEGSGGQSIFGLLEGPEKRFFSGEKMPKIRHTNAGLLSMVCTGDMMVGSQFFFTLAPDLDSLNPVHCVIGEVTEGHDVLRKLNEVICDETYRPYQDVRITHTVVLEDPFNDPKGFRAPSRSPSPSAERLKGGRIAPDEEIDETQGKTAEEIQELIEEKEAKARATILEIVGDLPDADIAPPENVLFVCKLNPVTTDEDLEIIFSRFGKIVSCEVIRDKKTGDSLQYAFIEFADKKYCEEAYFKMDNVLIDDRRIHVDFSQSVSKMRWLGKGRGVRYFNDEEAKHNHNKEQSNRPEGKDRRENKDRQWGDRNKRYDNEKWNNHDTDKHNEKRHHLHKTRDMENHKRKSRSRSRSRLEKSRSDKRDNSSRNQNYSKSTNNEDSHKYTDNKERENRSSHRSKTLTSTKSQHLEHNDKYDRRKNYEYSNNNEKDIKESQSKLKRKQFEDTDSLQNHKRVKKHKNIEPHTPSPVSKKNKLNRREKDTDIKKKKKNVKKKRKPSTSSSDSESSDSSSSSSDSSSSSEDRNRKRIKRRKKKYSSSSSSESSSSSSSTSSSDSSSESTSSSSNSEPSKRKRNKKPSKRHITKKSKKKS